MPRLITGNTRAQELAIQNRMRVARQRSLQARMTAELNRANNAAAKAVMDGLDVDSVMLEHQRNTFTLLQGFYNSIMPAFGERILQSAKKSFSIVETKDSEDIFDRIRLEWVAAFTADKVVQITSTTQKQIKRVIESSSDVGQAEIARRIRANTAIISPVRSLVIARTETHAASQFSVQAAGQSLGISGLKKEWVAAEDARTRADHANADGQIVAHEEKFSIAGYALLHPGDASGPPEQVINCRCASALVVD